MRTLVRSVPLMLLVLGGCAGRFRANTPRQIVAADPQSAFETALATVRALGYSVTELDPPRGFFRVKSKVDGDLRGSLGMFGQLRLIERVTYLSFQVQPNAVLSITANGYHVRGDVVHVKVADEVEQLASCIQDHTRVAALP